jgi:dihydrofolate reductase
MSKVRVAAFGISVDGHGAGPDQRLDAPIGQGGEQLMQWFFPTRTFQCRINGQQDGETGVDDDFAARSFENVGAWIIGRNMFGPVRGLWPGERPDEWKGWWGPNPPFHMPVFVLTHQPRVSLEMRAGRSSTSSTTGSRRCSNLRGRRRAERIFASAAGSPPCAPI